MAVSSVVRGVFSHFQNLNLLALLQDLRAGQVVRHTWFSGSLLCPVAHGLADNRQVQRVRVLGQAGPLGQSCDEAAQFIGAEPDAVLRFVRYWDEENLSSDHLRRQLEELWTERLEDAEAVQRMLRMSPVTLRFVVPSFLPANSGMGNR